MFVTVIFWLLRIDQLYAVNHILVPLADLAAPESIAVPEPPVPPEAPNGAAQELEIATDLPVPPPLAQFALEPGPEADAVSPEV